MPLLIELVPSDSFQILLFIQGLVCRIINRDNNGYIFFFKWSRNMSLCVQTELIGNIKLSVQIKSIC